MVLGLKPMGKLVTSKKKLSTRQNQGLEEREIAMGEERNGEEER